MGGLLHWLDLCGVAVFAVSGALEAARKQLDLVGFLFVGAVTGIGGGTLRDVLLDRGPVFWVHEPRYLWVTSAAAVATFLVAPHIQRRAVVLLWADALGMAVFCVLGARTALEAGAGPEVAVLMGTMTATFGGLIRDVVCTETPLLLKREIYATAAAAGRPAGTGPRRGPGRGRRRRRRGPAPWRADRAAPAPARRRRVRPPPPRPSRRSRA